MAAGYDPQGLKSFFAKLKALEEGQSRSDLEKFLSTHPATSERIRRIDKLIAQAGSPTGEPSSLTGKRGWACENVIGLKLFGVL